jgi:hypothetical protein
MQHLKVDSGKDKGWFVGPWNSEIPVPIGYANTGVSLAHYHTVFSGTLCLLL